jgi:3-hydroxyisobutyrate dehydrogenase-like beta-hydroxyacid dehydrogenase
MGTEVGRAATAEVLWASEGRSVATARRASSAGFRDAGTLQALVAESEIVLCLCPPAVAEEVAGAVAEAGFTGLYIEANAIAPGRAERIASMVGACGAQVVDASVISRSGLNLYLSGDEGDVERAAALFAGTDVTPLSLPGGVGAASALKMAFGGWNKIGLALVAQACAIARAYGVEEALAAEGVEGHRLVRAAPKAWRWSPELEEVSETCANIGLPAGLGSAAAELYERWAGHRDQPVELERLLEDLVARRS